MEALTLDNGLAYIFEKREGAGVVTAQIWVKAGSKFEDPATAGITHFIEHLIFKGTDKVKANEMASRIEALGGIINAYTSYDNTVYHIVIPTGAFDEGFDLLADAVKNASFPEEEIKKERQVVLEEIKMGEDNPRRKLFLELFSRSYTDHPYGRPVIGYEETVKNMTRDQILDYFERFYRPDNMAVVIVGDFDEKKAVEIIRKYFGEERPSTAITTLPADDGKKTGAGSVRIIERDVRESYVTLSYRVPPIVDADIPALEVLGAILGEGESSRLQVELKFKQGIVSNASTYLFTPKEEGLFVIYASFKGRDYGGVVRSIDTELERFFTDNGADDELVKAKNMIKASYIYAAETVQGIAHQIGNYQTLTGSPRFVDTFLKRVDGVTRDDLRRVGERYLTGKERTLVALLPKDTRDTDSRDTFQLKNGITCAINKNGVSPSFAFRIGFVGGVKEEPRDKNGLFNIMTRMLLKGTKTRDAAAIARTIDLLAGDISPYNGKSVFGLAGRFLSKDMTEVFRLLSELLTMTVFTEDELKKVKKEILAEIRQREDEPVSFAFLRFNEALYGSHPYSRDPLGKEEDIEGITLSDVEDCYRRFVVPANAVLAISGDVDEKELRDIVEGKFAQWRGPGNSLVKKPILTPEKKDIWVEREMMQTHLIFGFLGPGLIDEDRYAVEVLDSILSGMGGRIHKVLREEKPYAYALTFFNHMAYETGGMGVYIGTDKRLVPEVNAIVRSEIEKILKDGFSGKEVEDGKNYLIGAHYIRTQSNGSIATSMCLDTMYGFDPFFFKVWPGHIEKVTVDDINRITRKYLILDKMVQVSLGSGK